MTPTATDVVNRFFEAACAGDQDKLVAIYATDAVIWHNVDKLEKDVAASLTTLAWLVENIENYRYEEVRVVEFGDGGVLRRHVCRGTIKELGIQIEVPIAAIAQVEEGRIARLEEYFDLAQCAPGAA